ncbi:MAG: hypothetical protein KF708_06305 [Pirellulales bacterium]|nr:hypothetical protein [Pirellulales bacterium]
MPNAPTAPDLLNREFLQIRAKLLELAAAFDRIGRAPGSIVDDPRLVQVHRALEILNSENPHRAEQIQQIFSREYDPAWREQFGL